MHLSPQQNACGTKVHPARRKGKIRSGASHRTLPNPFLSLRETQPELSRQPIACWVSLNERLNLCLVPLSSAYDTMIDSAS